MTLLAKILDWSNSSLKPWQQDAARRLFQNSLDATALDDLYAMLKDSVGLTDPHGRKPVPLNDTHLPVTASKGDAVTLLALRDVKNTNRLATGQTLKFAKKGMTVVYGGNGSGKSGYARILKRACRSRDVTEDVRPNVLDKGSAKAVPEAKFDIELNGQQSTITWSKTAPAPQELATVAVFDTYCARAYLDQQQEIAYLPFGLDVVENLAQVVLPKITEKLNAEIATTLTTKDAFNHLLGATKVGALITELNEGTKIDDIETLAHLSTEELARTEQLTKTLGEADPKTKAKDLRLAAGRMTSLKSRIEASTNWVKDEAIQKLRTIDDEAEAAIAAEAVAATALRAGETLLPGTGGMLWKTLFEAARAYSTGDAYENQAFPHLHEDSKCVLCQQNITGDAVARLERFESYVQQNVAKVAADKRASRTSAISKIENASLSIDFKDHVEELNHLDPEVAKEIEDFDKIILARRDWLLNAQKTRTWDGVPPFPTDPCVRLKNISDILLEQAANYEKATDEKQKLLLTAEQAELKARAALALQKDAIIALVGRMRVKALLTKCKDDLKTKPISEKAKEFATTSVTVPLRAALKEEFDVLGVAAMMPRLDENVERGKMKHRLSLDLAVQAQIRDVLSEGEQRAVAIGSFLAELRTGNHGGGIIFDDPVSSLDHFRRQNVARRLVEEAKIRQVVIFTHDTSFLGELRDVIEQTGIEHIIHYLEWEGNSSGRVESGLPWEHQGYKDRIDKLQKAQSALAKAWPPYPNAEQSAAMRRQYNLVRATIERVIQDVIFNGVVVRYRDWIKVGNLSEVVGFGKTECDEIERLHKKCCDVVDAHDPSSDKNAPVPDAAQLGADIAALVAVTDTIKTQREQRKKAKSLATAVSGQPTATAAPLPGV
ncbi:AAA family ATPase [Burkholderia gladioli]|uniref:AAA family ATPase n=1 Tax=Burkholderia gladioli TaxID=28095 RepID=UPI0016414416|nr:AAA family ATPase [Burkholderia gladioli]